MERKLKKGKKGEERKIKEEREQGKETGRGDTERTEKREKSQEKEKWKGKEKGEERKSKVMPWKGIERWRWRVLNISELFRTCRSSVETHVHTP